MPRTKRSAQLPPERPALLAQLTAAIENRDLARCRAALKNIRGTPEFWEWHFRTDQERLPMHLAIRMRQPNVVAMLLREHARLASVDAVHEAIQAGHPDILRALVEARVGDTLDTEACWKRLAQEADKGADGPLHEDGALQGLARVLLELCPERGVGHALRYVPRLRDWVVHTYASRVDADALVGMCLVPAVEGLRSKGGAWAEPLAAAPTPGQFEAVLEQALRHPGPVARAGGYVRHVQWPDQDKAHVMLRALRAAVEACNVPLLHHLHTAHQVHTIAPDVLPDLIMLVKYVYKQDRQHPTDADAWCAPLVTAVMQYPYPITMDAALEAHRCLPLAAFLAFVDAAARRGVDMAGEEARLEADVRGRRFESESRVHSMHEREKVWELFKRACLPPVETIVRLAQEMRHGGGAAR